MKQWLKLIKYKKLLLFTIILLIMGLFFGAVYYFKQNDVVKQTLINSILELPNNLVNNRINNIVIHLIIGIAVIVLSFTIISVPIIFFYIFFEGISIGFSFALIVNAFGFKGIFLFLIYSLLYKFIYLVLITYLVIRAIRITKNVIGFIIYRKSTDLEKNIIINIRKVVIILLLIFIYDIAIFFASPTINKLLINFL